MNEPHLASAEFGGFWIRALATLADSAIVFLLVALAIAGGVRYFGEAMMPAAVLAACLLAFLYWPALHASPLQASFGKAMLRLRVTGYQGERISFLRAVGRELAKVLSAAVAMIGYFMAGFTARNQALHDLLASTYVVREGQARLAPAVVTGVAGFVLPVLIVPLVVEPAILGSLKAMVDGAVSAAQSYAAR
jgi:uncharacterized RDD family membrane protein YckC